MSKKKRSYPDQHRQKSSKQPVKSGNAKKVKPDYILFERINGFLERHMNMVFFVSFFLTLSFSILLFDIRFSTSGDDSAYVIRAYDFIHHFKFPDFQGSLYPIILSPLIILFGIHAVPLKSLSLLFILGATWLTYKTFKNRIPAFLLSSLLILFSVNSYMLYYASQTFSEACFVLMQALVFYVFFIFFIDREKDEPFKVPLLQHLILASCVLFLGLTRSIGFSCIFAIAGYFILRGQWKNMLCFIISFAIVLAAFQGLKLLIWGSSDMHFTSQIQSLMSKNYYNPGLGKEDFQGFIHRLMTNSNLYISKYLYTIIGLREADDTAVVYPFVTIITYIMLVVSIIIGFWKNKYLLFTGLYATIIIFITFLIAHTSWGQSRLIIPYFPLILLMLLFLLYHIFSYKKLHAAQLFFPVLVLVLFGLTLKTTLSQVKYARQITNKYSGLTPDWENYCKISEWASKNLPPDAFVACRKPSVSFIYGNGKRFFGITQLTSLPGNSLLPEWQRTKAHWFFLSAASLEKSLPTDLYYVLKNGIVAYGVNGELFAENIEFFIMNFPDSVRMRTFGEMKNFKIFPSDNVDSLKFRLNDHEAKISVIYPDTLLNILMNAKATHVLRASLRASPKQKTNLIINTVERFMDFIKYKYPKIVTRIMQVGENDNEPSVLYQLNYNLYGLKFRNEIKKVQVPDQRD